MTRYSSRVLDVVMVPFLVHSCERLSLIAAWLAVTV
jgi:hypothetical protein